MKTVLIIFFIFISVAVSAQSVTLNKATFGIDRVNNTPDADKPISKAVAADLKRKSDSLKAMSILISQMKVNLQIKSDSIRLVYNFLVAQAKDIGVFKTRRDTFWVVGLPGAGTKTSPWDFRGFQTDITNIKTKIIGIEKRIAGIEKRIAEILLRLNQ